MYEATSNLKGSFEVPVNTPKRAGRTTHRGLTQSAKKLQLTCFPPQKPHCGAYLTRRIHIFIVLRSRAQKTRRHRQTASERPTAKSVQPTSQFSRPQTTLCRTPDAATTKMQDCVRRVGHWRAQTLRRASEGGQRMTDPHLVKHRNVLGKFPPNTLSD